MPHRQAGSLSYVKISHSTQSSQEPTLRPHRQFGVASSTRFRYIPANSLEELRFVKRGGPGWERPPTARRCHGQSSISLSTCKRFSAARALFGLGGSSRRSSGNPHQRPVSSGATCHGHGAVRASGLCGVVRRNRPPLSRGSAIDRLFARAIRATESARHCHLLGRWSPRYTGSVASQRGVAGERHLFPTWPSHHSNSSKERASTGGHRRAELPGRGTASTG